MDFFDIDTPEGMAAAVAWTEALVRSLKDGAVWVVPRSGSILKIDKTQKTVTLIAEYYSDEAIKKVFTQMGWTWIS